MLPDSGSTSVLVEPNPRSHLCGYPILDAPTTQNGDSGTASPAYVRLRVGDLVFDREAKVATSHFNKIAVDGLLPTGDFGSFYVCNSGAFVIFEPKRHRFGQTRTWDPGRQILGQ